ncbi:MAG: GNAT family N-acetyltransferase [Gemmatimonadota bacterium]
MVLSVTNVDQLTIRAATCEDAPALAEFAERSFRDTFGCDNVESDMAQYVARAFGEETQRAELADSHRVVLLAEIGGVIAGYAQLMNDSAPDDIAMERSVIELERFYVAHEWHGRGIAQQLMARATEAADRSGAATLWLAVWERNPRAIAFYRKSGFVDVGSRLFLLGSDRQTDRVMSRLLPS